MLLYVAVLSVAVATALLVVVVATALPGGSRALRSRLIELGLDGTTTLEDGRRDRRRKKKLLEMVEVLGSRAQREIKDWSPLRDRLVMAGYRDPSALPVYLGIRIAGGVALFLLGAVVATAAEFGTAGVLVLGLWGAATGWFVPSFVLSRTIARRQKELRRALPDALDLLVICVEAGLGLNQALVRVAGELRHLSELMTEEIAQTNLQIRAGTPRERALKDLAHRTGSPEIRSLVTMLIQTDRFGTSIARSLRVHAETLRDKRRQRAEEAAARTTIWMIFPLALCILPALFVVVLGPAFIQILQTMRGF